MSDVLTQPDAFAASEIVQAEVMSQLASLTARYEQRRYWRYAEPLVSAEQAGDSGVFAVAADARVVMPARMAVFRRLRVRL